MSLRNSRRRRQRPGSLRNEEAERPGMNVASMAAGIGAAAASAGAAATGAPRPALPRGTREHEPIEMDVLLAAAISAMEGSESLSKNNGELSVVSPPSDLAPSPQHSPYMPRAAMRKAAAATTAAAEEAKQHASAVASTTRSQTTDVDAAVGEALEPVAAAPSTAVAAAASEGSHSVSSDGVQRSDSNPIIIHHNASFRAGDAATQSGPASPNGAAATAGLGPPKLVGIGGPHRESGPESSEDDDEWMYDLEGRPHRSSSAMPPTPLSPRPPPTPLDTSGRSRRSTFFTNRAIPSLLQSPPPPSRPQFFGEDDIIPEESPAAAGDGAAAASSSSLEPPLSQKPLFFEAAEAAAASAAMQREASSDVGSGMETLGRFTRLGTNVRRGSHRMHSQAERRRHSSKIRQKWRRAIRLVSFANSLRHPGKRRMLMRRIGFRQMPIVTVRVLDKEIFVLFVSGADVTESVEAPKVVVRQFCATTLQRLNMTKLDVEIGHIITTPESGAFSVFADRVACISESKFVPDMQSMDESVRPGKGKQYNFLLFDSRTGKQLACWALDDRARVMTWSPTDDMTAVGGGRGIIRIFLMPKHNPDAIECVKVKTNHHEDIVALVFSNDGKRLASGSKDKTFRIYDLTLPNHPVIFRNLQPMGRVYGLAFHPQDHDILLTGSDDNKFRMVRVHISSESDVPLLENNECEDYVRAVRFSNDGSEFFIGSKDGTVKVFDTQTGEQTVDLDLKHRSINQDRVDVIYTSPDQRTEQFVVGGLDRIGGDIRELTIFNFRDHVSAGDIIPRRNSHQSAVNCIAFSPHGDYVASGGNDGAMVLFNIRSGRTLFANKAHKGAINSLAWNPAGNTLVTAGADHTLMVIERRTHKVTKVAVMDSAILSVTWSPCGQYVVVGLRGLQSIRMYATSPWREVHRFDKLTRSTNCVAYSPDGKLIVAGHTDGRVRLFDVDTQMQIWAAHKHTKEVFAVAFHPDQELIASGSRDKTIAIYQVDTGHEVLKITSHTNWVKDVRFTAMGELISCGLDGVVRLFDPSKNFSSGQFSVRSRVFPDCKGIHCISPAPAHGPFCGLVAAGSDSGTIYFVDYSMTSQQPTYAEAVMVIQRDRDLGNSDFELTRDMVHSFPFVVNACDKDGFNLYHHAVTREETQLLRVLLEANIPRFWLPVNNDGFDALHYATRSRASVKMILDHINNQKRIGRLSPMLPVVGNRLLKNLLLLTSSYSDLVASFLQGFGLDEAPAEVGSKVTQMTRGIGIGRGSVAGSEEPNPRDLWISKHRKSLSKSRLSIRPHTSAQKETMMAQKCSIPLIAGILPPDDVCAFEPESDEISVRNSALHTFVRTENAKLLSNIVMKKTIEFKWNKYARKLFIFELAIFLFYLACFFTFSLLLAELEIGASWSTMTASGRGTASIVLALIIPLFGVRQMFREGQQIQYHSGKMIEKIVTHLQDGWSFVQLSNALMSIITCILHLASSPATRALASLAAFGLWVQVLYFLRARESTGALVRMIFRVLHLSIPFLFVMLIVLLGMATSFYVLFADLPDEGEDETFSRHDSYYDTLFGVWTALVLNEMESTLRVVESTKRVVLVKLLFVTFSVLLSIFMLNLLISLMQDFMAKIHEDEGDAFPYEKARIITELEQSMSDKDLKKKALFPTWLQVLTPKSMDSERENEWQGTVSAVRQIQERSQQRTDAALEDLRSDLEHSLRVVKGDLETQARSDSSDIKRMVLSLSQRLDSIDALRNDIQRLWSVVESEPSGRASYSEDFI